MVGDGRALFLLVALLWLDNVRSFVEFHFAVVLIAFRIARRAAFSSRPISL